MDLSQRFTDRKAAGQELAKVLGAFARAENTLVLGLPRGGVPVAYEVARALDVPLDVLLVRKLGVPGQEELAMGAIALGDIRVDNADIRRQTRVTPEELETVLTRERAVLEQRNTLYRGARPPPVLRGKTVIVVDDGLATGATMRAAVAALRQSRVGAVVVAVPVGAPSTCAELARSVDTFVCLVQPEPLYSIGQWYLDFSQTSDQEVGDLLERSRVFSGR